MTSRLSMTLLARAAPDEDLRRRIDKYFFCRP
jgi:hypothetical protein